MVVALQEGRLELEVTDWGRRELYEEREARRGDG